MNEASSLRMDSIHSVLVSNVGQVLNTAAVVIFYSHSQISAQKSELEENITSRGHICDFYPKFHCEFNFIEQTGGLSNGNFIQVLKTTDIGEMENVIVCLDDILSLQTQKFVVIPFATWFIKLYHTGMQTSLQDLSQHMHRV